jgi:hypothetical protein
MATSANSKPSARAPAPRSWRSCRGRTCCWKPGSRAWLAALELPPVSRELAGDYLGLTGALQDRIDRLDREIRQRARSDPRVKVLTQLPGIGPFTALVIVAEVGDISRFASARQLASLRPAMTPPSTSQMAPVTQQVAVSSPAQGRPQVVFMQPPRELPQLTEAVPV